MTWKFSSEFDLEDFVWANLSSLFNLKPLSRQHSVENQVCDILAVTPERQLVVIELKNVEDRYVVQQLTRYYASLNKIQPFSEQINYELPIRLVAIAPAFHSHNFIDKKYNQLDVEFCEFSIIGDNENLIFNLHCIDLGNEFSLDINPKFHSSIKSLNEENVLAEKAREIGRPPKSLRAQMEQMTSDQVDLILSLRRQILEFDDRMREIGYSSRTQYGLAKDEKDVYKTKLCAEFLRDPLNNLPELFLMLPRPKKKKVFVQDLHQERCMKSLTWAGVSLWRKDRQVSFYFEKSRHRCSYQLSYQEYAKYCCKPVLGYLPRVESCQDLVDLALNEWSQLVDG